MKKAVTIRKIPFQIVRNGKEIPYTDDQYHRVVREISHIERFAQPHSRNIIAKFYSRLTTEDKLFGSCKYMI